jgi:hypothetical protein
MILVVVGYALLDRQIASHNVEPFNRSRTARAGISLLEAEDLASVLIERSRVRHMIVFCAWSK